MRGVFNRSVLDATCVEVKTHNCDTVIITLLHADKLLYVCIIKNKCDMCIGLSYVNLAEWLILIYEGSIASVKLCIFSISLTVVPVKL